MLIIYTNLHHRVSEVPTEINVVVRKNVLQAPLAAHLIQDGHVIRIYAGAYEQAQVGVFDVSHLLHLPSQLVGQLDAVFLDELHNDVPTIPIS